METEKTAAFFEAGLVNYGNALRAVTEFKELLTMELQNALGALPRGSVLELAPEPAFMSSNGLPPSHVYFSTFGSLAMFPAGSASATPTLGRVELGIGWAPPFPCATGIAAYAAVSGVPWAKRITRPDGAAAALHKAKGGSTYLTRDVSAKAALGIVLGELLADLEVACRKQVAPVSG